MPRFSLPLRPDDICHHGVEGMHWGVKNGPPYPLDSTISMRKKLKDRGGDIKGLKTNDMTKPGSKMIDFSKSYTNTQFFKQETVPKMRDYIKTRNEAYEEKDRTKRDKMYAASNEKLKEAAQTRAMKEFFSDKKVKAVYEKRNKRYDNSRNANDPDKEYFDAAKEWDKEIKSCIKKFFGSEASKPYSSTNKNTNEKLMEKILEYLDSADDSIASSSYPYTNPYAWRWYS